MEVNIQLIRIIQEMRTEINKLEKENQALRVKLTPSRQKTSGSREKPGDEKEEEAREQSLASLHDVVSTDITPVVREYQGFLCSYFSLNQFHHNDCPNQTETCNHRRVSSNQFNESGHSGDVMIVRRYSISSPAHSFARNDPWKTRDHSGTQAINKHSDNGVLEAQGAVNSLACSSVKKQDNEERMLAADSCSSNGFSQKASPEDGFGCRDKMKTVSFLLPMDLSSYSNNASSLKYSPDQTTNQLSIITE
ncbi:putative coiled-coil domain-containing protein 195 [Erethizon dorsatum]